MFCFFRCSFFFSILIVLYFLLLCCDFPIVLYCVLFFHCYIFIALTSTLANNTQFSQFPCILFLFQRGFLSSVVFHVFTPRGKTQLASLKHFFQHFSYHRVSFHLSITFFLAHFYFLFAFHEGHEHLLFLMHIPELSTFSHSHTLSPTLIFSPTHSIRHPHTHTLTHSPSFFSHTY